MIELQQFHVVGDLSLVMEMLCFSVILLCLCYLDFSCFGHNLKLLKKNLFVVEGKGVVTK